MMTSFCQTLSTYFQKWFTLKGDKFLKYFHKVQLCYFHGPPHLLMMLNTFVTHKEKFTLILNAHL